jgi:Domain of unknown function (DUF4340)
MNSRRFIRILAAAIVAICAALGVGHWRGGTSEPEGGLLLPGLSTQLSVVTSVTIRKGAALPAVMLHKQADRWTVAQRADYPADIAKLRKLLQALASARIVEEKTSDPANYRALGVDSPDAPDAIGTEIKIVAADATHSVIVGKPSAGGSFVRLSQQARGLLVTPGVSFDAEPRDWIDARLLDIQAAQVKQIEIKPAKGPAVKRMDTDFAALADLSALDVAPADSVDFKAAMTATVTLTDGAVITLTGVTAQEKHWITVTSSADAALTEKARGRAIEISASRYDSIFKP